MRHDQLLLLGPELLILHEMVIVQDRTLQVIRVPTWVVQLYFPGILHLGHKLDNLMCGYFKSDICCCALKILHGSNPIIIHLDYI